ncbi:helix-turn-helix domain-containing protein, partial [Enterococcus faecalis]|uniref:helix-turn-helix domain-containing protein n=1 Tax=Enterococcus faecalis TaxID=1351 RepID=UPI00117801B1
NIYLNQLVLKEENESQPKQMIENERIAAMITYISQNLDQPLTLEQMEKNFFVTKYYVTREFKKHTGFTFHQFVLKKKLLYAKQLLKEYRSASDVYLKCGFKSYPHFLKSFKKEFSMTPKEFLVQHKNNQIIHFDHYEESIKKVRLE